MFEWSVFFTIAVLIAVIIIAGLLAVICSFVSKDRNPREKLDNQLYEKLEEIFSQVQNTNDQVNMLQEWRQNFTNETNSNFTEIKMIFGNMPKTLSNKSNRPD